MVCANPLRDVRAESMAAGDNWRNNVYARSDKVIRRDVGGETVLVPVAASGAADLEYLYRMNAVGAAVWDLLNGRRTITEIAAQIRAAFDMSRQDPAQICAALDTSDTMQAGGWRLETGDCRYLRRERNKPFRTLDVSTLNAHSSWRGGSARNPRRAAKPTWYSTSRAEP